MLLIGLAASACKSKQETPAIPATPAPTYPSVLGVPDCDRYIAKFQLCLEQHVPDLAKIPLKIGLEEAIKEWKKKVTLPDGVSQLGPACQLALQATQKATEKFHCEW